MITRGEIRACFSSTRNYHLTKYRSRVVDAVHISILKCALMEVHVIGSSLTHAHTCVHTHAYHSHEHTPKRKNCLFNLNITRVPAKKPES